MLVDLSSFKKALENLDKAISRSILEPQDEIIRDGVIQRFEYTYELSWKMLKRQLEQEMPTPSEIDSLSFKELIREGVERGLVEKAESWFLYREQRNITSHIYDGDKAKSVYQTAVTFMTDAKKLFSAMQKRNK